MSPRRWSLASSSSAAMGMAVSASVSACACIQVMAIEPVADRFFAFDHLERRGRATAGVARAGIAQPGNQGQLRRRQARRAEREGGLIERRQAGGQALGAARDRRRRIVQFVRETGGQFAEREHLLVMQLVGSEQPRAIDHHVDQHGGQLEAVANHLRKVIAIEGERLDRFFRDDVARRSRHSRIRQEAGQVAAPPFGDLSRSRAPVDRDRQVAREQDEQPRRHLHRSEDEFTQGDMKQLATVSQPLQLFAGDPGRGPGGRRDDRRVRCRPCCGFRSCHKRSK